MDSTGSPERRVALAAPDLMDPPEPLDSPALRETEASKACRVLTDAPDSPVRQDVTVPEVTPASASLVCPESAASLEPTDSPVCPALGGPRESLVDPLRVRRESVEWTVCLECPAALDPKETLDSLDLKESPV